MYSYGFAYAHAIADFALCWAGVLILLALELIRLAQGFRFVLLWLVFLEHCIRMKCLGFGQCSVKPLAVDEVGERQQVILAGDDKRLTILAS